jgi:hypothetical protein
MAQASKPARRQQQRGECNAVFADNDHPVAGPDPQRGQDGCDLGNALLQIAVAPGFPVFDQRNPVGGFGNVYCRNFVDPARQADSNRVEIDRL